MTSKHLNNRECFDDILKWAGLDHKQQHGFSVSKDSAYRLLQECIKRGSLELVRRAQFLVIYYAFDSVSVLADNLIRFFTTCGSPFEANQTFATVSEPTHYTWNAIMDSQTKIGNGELTLLLYSRLQYQSTKPDIFTFPRILKACINLGAIEQGRYVHEQILQSEIQFDTVVWNCLVDMYAKCGRLEEAQAVFNRLIDRNVVTWGTMVAAYAQGGEGCLAFKYFQLMQDYGLMPDKATFLSILKACRSLEQGRHIHEKILQSGLQFNSAVGNTLIDMYANCGSLYESCQVFSTLQGPKLVAWNVMISAYAQHGEGYLAMQCFKSMQQEGIKPDRVTFLGVLQACASIGALEQGIQIHKQITESGLQFDIVVGSILVDMYAKCKNLEQARKVFDTFPTPDVALWNAMISGYAQPGEIILASDCFAEMQCKGMKPDVITWSAMITGYAHHGQGIQALECFDSMQREGIKPAKATYLSVLKACANMGAIEQGRRIHRQVIDIGLQVDIVIGSTLIDMYAKCGAVEETQKMFSNLPNKDVVLWGAMIMGYAQLGECRLAMQSFKDMVRDGSRPNNIAFLGIFAAFSHAGLVDEGLCYLKIMTGYHGIQPDTFHINCLVDLLGQAGCFAEAKSLLETTLEPDIRLWITLLNACKALGHVELAAGCFHEIVKLDSSCAAAYVLMSNVFAHAQMDVYEIVCALGGKTDYEFSYRNKKTSKQMESVYCEQ